tara:strand:- start:1461 stop:1676 length:216 start_codon:yes stop_codon:yes gene_type:complete
MIGGLEFGRSKTGEAECTGRFMLFAQGRGGEYMIHYQTSTLELERLVASDLSFLAIVSKIVLLRSYSLTFS